MRTLRLAALPLRSRSPNAVDEWFESTDAEKAAREGLPRDEVVVGGSEGEPSLRSIS